MKTRTWVLGLLLALGCNHEDNDDMGDDTGNGTGNEAGTGNPTEDPTVPDPTAASQSDPTADDSASASADSGNDSGNADCDPASCKDFCLYARCLFEDDIDGAKCEDRCTSYCGDGSFEDADKGMVACQLEAGADLTCGTSQKCCDDWLTNALCP